MINLRKKRIHESGMWKVAYADFMTAMMVLFFMLWVINNVSEEQLNGLGDYFSPPAIQAKIKEDNVKQNSLKEQRKFIQPSILARKIQAKLRQFSKNIIVTEDEEAISITIISSAERRLFSEKSFQLSNAFDKELKLIANEIKNTAFYISIVGHTNSAEFAYNIHYSNWELSADRASSIRHALLKAGIDQQRISSVVGKGDSNPITHDHPDSLQNRRIDIKLLKGQQQIGRHKKNTPGIFN